jgi:predicted secreted protein
MNRIQLFRLARRAALAGLCVATLTQAQTLPAPQNVLGLNASASVEVTKDWLTVVFATAREGSDAASVQSQLRQALETALAEARKAAQPGQVEVQTGAFSLMPRYAPPTPPLPATPTRPGTPGSPGGIVGWQGSAELVVEGRDAQAIAQLSGRIRSVSIARVGWGLSREARQKVEADVTAQAIERFRAQADAVSRQFGFGGWSVREVQLSSDLPGGAVPQLLMSAKAMRGGADEALPVEAGKATVTATVSGSVQMK